MVYLLHLWHIQFIIMINLDTNSIAWIRYNAQLGAIMLEPEEHFHSMLMSNASIGMWVCFDTMKWSKYRISALLYRCWRWALLRPLRGLGAVGAATRIVRRSQMQAKAVVLLRNNLSGGHFLRLVLLPMISSRIAGIRRRKATLPLWTIWTYQCCSLAASFFPTMLFLPVLHSLAHF